MKETKDQIKMLMKMQKNLVNMKKQMIYYRDISIDDLIKELNQFDIHITEEDIINKYKECIDFKKVDDYLYYRDINKWENLNNKRTIINSDAIYHLIDKVIEKNFDTEKLADPHYITIRMDEIEDTPKHLIQEKVLSIICSIVEYAQRNQIHRLENILEEYNVNEFLKYYIKKCHNRDNYFKEVIKDYYDTFEDADRSLYKLK